MKDAQAGRQAAGASQNNTTVICGGGGTLLSIRLLGTDNTLTDKQVSKRCITVTRAIFPALLRFNTLDRLT